MVSFNASRAIFFDHNFTAWGEPTGKSVAAIVVAFQLCGVDDFPALTQASCEAPIQVGGTLSLTPDQRRERPLEVGGTGKHVS
jgi:hypothetical protein